MRPATRFAFALVLALGAKTALAQQPGPLRAADYFPLNKGATWVYKVDDQEVVNVVTGTERFKDEDCARMETRIGREPKTDELYAVRPDGVYRVAVRSDALVPPVKVLPDPVRLGDTWAMNSKFGTQTLKGTLTVKNDREKVKVPAGEFETVFVEGRDLDVAGSKVTLRIWFGRARGIVKEEFEFSGSEKVTIELAKFEPGERPPTPAPGPAPAEPAWAFPQACRILPAPCVVLPVTQECRGCCARSVRCWVRRR